MCVVLCVGETQGAGKVTSGPFSTRKRRAVGMRGRRRSGCVAFFWHLHTKALNWFRPRPHRRRIHGRPAGEEQLCGASARRSIDVEWIVLELLSVNHERTSGELEEQVLVLRKLSLGDRTSLTGF